MNNPVKYFLHKYIKVSYERKIIAAKTLIYNIFHKINWNIRSSWLGNKYRLFIDMSSRLA